MVNFMRQLSQTVHSVVWSKTNLDAAVKVSFRYD